MGRSSGSSQHPVLHREVETPQRPSAGLGVMLIASAAMFFAVASSAFILRARMPDRCYHRTTPSPTVVAPQPAAIPQECEVVERTNPDGSVSLVFDLCARDLDIADASAASEPGTPAPRADR